MSQKNLILLAVGAAVLFYLVKTGKLKLPTAAGGGAGDAATIPPNPGRAGVGIDTSSARALRNTTIEVRDAQTQLQGDITAAGGLLGALRSSGVGDIFSRIFSRTGKTNPVTSGSGAGAPVSNRNLGPIANNPDGNTSLDTSTASSPTLDAGIPYDPGANATGTSDQWDGTSPESTSYFDASLANA